MKVGDPWECPHCGNSSFLKKESVMDGWKKTGEVLKCASCSAFVEDVVPEPDSTPEEAHSRATDALAALLGGDDTEKVANPFAQTERRFCRDCRHRVMNAFRIYCSQHDKDVGPMDDCPQYEKRDVL
ncbi:MAG: hypothetical protein J6Q65_05740 [Lentisphaeria bacterium]|nr:hypothetical protein [Lentisphaeria bacterium]